MSTDFRKIEYNDAEHSYHIGGKPLVGVTTIVKHMTPEFDREGISQRMAEREGVTQEAILRKWEESGNVARDKGTRLHQYIEDTMNGMIDPVLRLINDRIPEMDAFDLAWTKMRAELKAKLVKQEWVIGDEGMGVAGRLDSLMSLSLPKTDKRILSVFDWKTGKLDTENRFGHLLPPLQKYDSSKLNQYSIQLSLYRLILERNTEHEYGDPYILHLRDDGSYHLHRARDMRTEILDFLKDGVPQEVAGDPAANKRVGHLTKVLDSVDADLIRNASRRSTMELCRVAQNVADLCSGEFVRP
jgi:hypothetical protein